MTDALLQLSGVRAAYGDLQALFDITLEVHAGEIVTLIGANGAGKTTTLRVISGALRATGGTVRFDGHDISGLPAHAMPERGISHVPEGRQLFPFMTVEENLDPRRAPPSTSSSSCSPGSRSAADSSPARCRAASSRWSPSHAA